MMMMMMMMMNDEVLTQSNATQLSRFTRLLFIKHGSPWHPLWMVPEVTEVIDMGVSIAYSNSWMVCFMENPSIDGR